MASNKQFGASTPITIVTANLADSSNATSTTVIDLSGISAVGLEITADLIGTAGSVNTLDIYLLKSVDNVNFVTTDNKKYVGSVQMNGITQVRDIIEVGDVNDYTESFASYLTDIEDISSYTIESSDALTISTSANATPDITYTVEATGNSTGTSYGLQQVQIQITTTDSRKETRIINFELTDPDEAI